jgi:Fe2+ transport system protein B
VGVNNIKQAPQSLLRFIEKADPIILSTSVVVYCCSVFAIWQTNIEDRWQREFLFVGVILAMIIGGIFSKSEEIFAAVYLIWGIAAAEIASWVFHSWVSANAVETSGDNDEVPPRPILAEKDVSKVVVTPS